jgi:hypothetical protein
LFKSRYPQSPVTKERQKAEGRGQKVNLLATERTFGERSGFDLRLRR